MPSKISVQKADGLRGSSVLNRTVVQKYGVSLIIHNLVATNIFDMIKTWFAAAVLFSGTALMAQNFEYANVELIEASYNGNIQIRTDDGASVYISPEFVNGSTSDPVAYVSGNAVNMAASFTIDCPVVPDSILVRGVGPEGITFPETLVLVQSSATTVHDFDYPATDAAIIFPDDVVRRFKPFKVGWDVSFNGGTNWYPVDSTENTLYVTKNSPQAETGNFKHWQTVFDISCRNADGESLDADVIAAVWNEFIDQSVVNWEGDSLYYYKPMNTVNTNLQSLLIFKNAQCYTYAQLFLSLIKIQGIVKTNNYVFITPINNSVCGNTVNRFIVKNWIFNVASAAGECASFPYKNTYITLLPAPYTSYDFIQEDVSDGTGIPGQNSANPSSYFNNHQISKIDGVYYDACYGVTFPTLADVPTDAFDGWGYRYTVGGTVHALFTTDLGLSSLSETITTY